MINRLYIIGNGFDLYHGMRTSYSDFHDYINTNDPEVCDFLKDYFYMETDTNNLWCQFERDLGTFDYRSFLINNNNTNPMEENFKPSDTYGLEDDLRSQLEEYDRNIRRAFRDWLFEVNIPKNIDIPLNLDKNALFLSFNYTNTLPQLYGISTNNIFYIHGSVESDSDLIFGHNKKLNPEPDFDEYGEPTRTLYTDAENASKIILHTFYKNTKAIIEKNSIFFSSLKHINEVIILGHSLNNIDLPYYTYLAQKVKTETKWSISWHNNNEKYNMKEALIRANIRKNLSFIKIEDLKA